MKPILSMLAFTMASVVSLHGAGCRDTGVGDPCTPEQEYDATFEGFSEKEVSVETRSFQCQTRTCLVNHFRGRVSCPEGQASDGSGGCVVPGSEIPVVPQRPAPLGSCVAAQCMDRQADDAVYCSCRCANLAGKTDDGSVYCECPEAFECTELVASIGAARSEGLTGRYCVKRGTEFRAGSNCNAPSDATTCVQ